jgi:polyisoprenoid-binding protein YceI
MRRLQVIAACAGLAPLVTGVIPARADSGLTRAIDPAKSKAQFSIRHVFVEHVTGTVPIASGSVTLSAGSTVPTGITAVLDATRISSGDPDRDGSLESPDYFDTKNFPTWTFVSSKIAVTGPATFVVDGTLRIHGVTQPERLDVTVSGTTAQPVYHATGAIDRHAFGMKGTRLDPAIGDEASVTLDVSLKAPSEPPGRP